MLTAYFYHKITGLPLTDPLVTVSVTLANMNNDTKVLDNAEMTPSSSIPWAFIYNYTLEREIDYMAYFSCSDDNYGEKMTQYYFPSARGIAVWSKSTQYDFNAQDRKNIQDLLDLKKDLEKYFNDTNSHIDLAKEQINDKIESIEIPEAKLEEVEAKKALKLIQNVDKKLTSYIESEMEEKEEIGALAREFTRQEMEDEMRRKEKEKEHEKMMEEKKKMEEEEDEKLLELIKKEFATQEEQEKEEKRKELEKELEELEKEKKEKEKELNSLK